MDPITMSLLATAGSGLITKLMNPGNAYKKAGQEAERYFQQGQNYLQPYNQQGQQAYGNVQGAMQNLLNPENLYGRFAQSYETSPYAKYAQEAAQNAGLDAASSMGLFGSTPAMRGIQAETSRIGAADRENYMKNMIDQYIHGATLSQNIYGQGANAAGQLSQNANNMGRMAGQTAYGQSSAGPSMFTNLLGTAGKGIADYNAMKGWNTYGGQSQTPGATPPIMPNRSPMFGGNY